MAEITAGLVKELREMTGLGMMECKKALTEAGGDLKKAEELLRIKSGAKAGKAASRVAAEGVIGAYLSSDAKTGALVELNCETDFVAKNDDFVAFAQVLAELVATKNPADVAALVAYPGIEAQRQTLVQKIGENISIRRFSQISVKRPGKAFAVRARRRASACWSTYEGADDVGKDVAMHISFSRPIYLAKSEVPAEIVARERDILAARAKESGKPAEIVAKMVDGGAQQIPRRNHAARTAVHQGRQAERGEDAGGEESEGARLRFLVVGEGIEKKASDFAAEVMAMAKKLDKPKQPK